MGTNRNTVDKNVIGSSSKDIFKTYLLHDARYAGDLEMPVLKGTPKIPKKLVPFSRAMEKSYRSKDAWVCFYEDDLKFMRIWNKPEHYINKLLDFPGIISPDFSMYRNMPAAMQYWSCFIGRALAHRYESDGGNVIPNVRLSDERTYKHCLEGLPKNSTLAIGTHGCVKRTDDKKYLKQHITIIIEQLTPKNLVIYGATPVDLFEKSTIGNTQLHIFESECSKFFKKQENYGRR